MIVVQLNGGLGNQLFQYALGRRLALDRQVPLKLDLRWFENHPERPYRLDQYKIHASSASIQEIEDLTRIGKNDVLSCLMRYFQRLLPYYHRYVVIEKNVGFDPLVLKAPKSAYLQGYWQSPYYFEPIGLTLRQEFELTEPVKDAELLSFMDGMSTGNSVSLHIRRGDYVSNPVTSAFHGICSMSYYKRAVTYLIEHWTDLHVYVFSDDIKWAKNHLVLNHPCEFVSGRFFIPDYVEMELMRHCKHHIIANSTFSWWAAWLSENRFKTVIAPENWVIKKEFDFSSIYLNNWIKI